MLDINKVKEIKITHNTRGASTKGVLTVVNSQKNGKRVTLSKEIFEKLNEPTSVLVGIYDTKLFITKVDLKSAITGSVCIIGKSRNIYSSDLVFKVTELFNLDFSERVSLTLSTIEWEELNGQPVAIISGTTEEV